MSDAERLVDEGELAAILRTSPRTIQGWRVRGGGPRFVKLSRGQRSPVRYRLNDVHAWLEAQTRTSTADRGAA